MHESYAHGHSATSAHVAEWQWARDLCPPVHRIQWAQWAMGARFMRPNVRACARLRARLRVRGRAGVSAPTRARLRRLCTEAHGALRKPPPLRSHSAIPTQAAPTQVRCASRPHAGWPSIPIPDAESLPFYPLVLKLVVCGRAVDARATGAPGLSRRRALEGWDRERGGRERQRETETGPLPQAGTGGVGGRDG